MSCFPSESFRSRFLDHHIIRHLSAAAHPAGPSQLPGAAQPDSGHLDIPQQEAQLPAPLVVGMEAHQRRQLGEPARAGKEVPEARERERSDGDLELMLALEAHGTERRRQAERCRLGIPADPAAELAWHVHPFTDELAYLDWQSEVVGENTLERIGGTGLGREMSRPAQFGAIRSGVPRARRGRSEPEQRADIEEETVAFGPVEARSRLGIGPGPIEERDQPMLEEIDEIRERRIFPLPATLVGVLGEMQRQRAIRTEYSERVLLEPRGA